MRDLSILVTEVDEETLVHPRDANYALLSGPTGTIKTLLSRLASNGAEGLSANSRVTGHLGETSPTANNEVEWEVFASSLNQEFETDFWLSLAGHPLLLNPETEPPNLI